MKKINTICFFGIYDKEYNRNRVLMEGLEKNGVRIIECHSGKRGILKYWDLAKKHHKIRNDYDLCLVAFPGQQAAVLAKLLSDKPVIFDVFISLYDTLVNDWKGASRYGLKAGYFWLIDWLSCRLADRILLDTDAHIGYFKDAFRIRDDKFIRVLVGSDYAKSDKPGDKNVFTVHFHGTFSPLQGVEVILEAARILSAEKDIRFRIVGTKIKERFISLDPGNIDFYDDMPHAELAEFIGSADICLGIFGNTPKARRVIPNKVYEAIALAKPAITMESEAAKELLTDRENIFFSRPGDASDLAEKIRELKNDPGLREEISANMEILHARYLSPAAIGKDLLTKIYEK